MRTLSLILSLTLLVNLFSKSHANWCEGQGPGACQLNIMGQPSYTNGGSKYAILWSNATIYDHTCKTLGYVERPMQHMAVYSQLPWTVVLTYLRTDSQYFEFCYDGTCYEGDFWCSTQDEYSMTTIECLHAFACASMDRQASS